jgi:hypothetical protein
MLSQKRCILSKVEEVAINEEEVDKVDKVIKERSALRNGVTRTRLEPTPQPTAGTRTRRTINEHETKEQMPATTVQKKDICKMTALSGERQMLYAIVGMLRSMWERTPLAINNDSKGPPPSAWR